MQITVYDLLKRNIFDKCTILTGANNLQRVVNSVSILETPDFEKYIIENSLVLTTFYPIKSEVELFKKLLFTLNEKNSSGLVIKVNRYLDDVPQEILEQANLLNFPIITLEYDANLSLLFNAIISEIQKGDYFNNNYQSKYSDILKTLHENPSITKLINTAKDIEELDLLIYNNKNGKLYSSSKQLEEYFFQLRNSNNPYNRIDDLIIFCEDIIYEEEPIYKIMILTHNDKRHLLHYYFEIFKLMVILIYQKKQENILKQNQFLLNFITNITSSYNTNKQLVEASRLYNWNIEFPIILILINTINKQNDSLDKNLIEYIRTVILAKFNIRSEELRYTLVKDNLLFIINNKDELSNYERINNIYSIITKKYPNLNFRIAYSNPIHYAKNIPQIYSLLTESITQIKNNNISTQIIHENNIRILNLLKYVDYNQLQDFTINIIGKLIEYEKKHNIPLINTLYTYIVNKFNMKSTAEQLFIHYNSLRYRLQVIESLGYNITDHKYDFFDLYLALYLHIYFYNQN